MRVSISKSTEAPINVTMLRWEISPRKRKMPSGPIVLNYRPRAQLPGACLKYKLNSGILFSSFQKSHLRQKAQEPIKREFHNISLLCPQSSKRPGSSMPAAPALRYARLVFNRHCCACVFFLLTLGLLGFCKNCNSTSGCWCPA